jgi:hypothetical protein
MSEAEQKPSEAITQGIRDAVSGHKIMEENMMGITPSPEVMKAMAEIKAANEAQNADKQAPALEGPTHPLTPLEPGQILRHYDPAPPWFGTLLEHMLSLYPAVMVHPQSGTFWWYHLHGFAAPAIEAALGEAPRRCDPLIIPSCELVRRLAEQWTKEQQAQQQARP